MMAADMTAATRVIDGCWGGAIEAGSVDLDGAPPDVLGVEDLW